MDLLLRFLRAEDEPEARAAHAELEAESFQFLLHLDPAQAWPSYLEDLERVRLGTDIPPDFVPATFLIAEVDGALVGRVSIRHELNHDLLETGGHIGAAVRPRYRRRGYAQEILRQALDLARLAGIEEILVTCEEDNTASIAVIERLGGVLEDVRRDPGHGRLVRRYWFRPETGGSS
jgi:predicted acetyltransferase